MGDPQAQLLAAVERVAAAIGATVVTRQQMRPSDIPLEWNGEVIAALRLEDLQGALRRLITAVERELGGRLADLPRERKQTAVRLLQERGAFLLRKAADDVADAMGVSRITIYNYLAAIDRSEQEAPSASASATTGDTG